MIKPVYNLFKKKVKMKSNKPLFNSSQNNMIPPLPKPEFKPPVEFTNPVEIKDTLTENEEKQTKFNTKTIIFAVIGVVLLAVLVYGGKKINNGTKVNNYNTEKQNEEILLAENERYKLEMEEYETKRKKLLENFQIFTKKRNDIINLLQANYKSASLNNQDFHKMFADKKLDSSTTLEEENESIDTAFMLKDDMEKKKMEMIESGKSLNKQKDDLLNQMQEVNKQIDDIANLYNVSYEGQKLPLTTEKTTENKQQVLNQQQPTQEKLKQ